MTELSKTLYREIFEGEEKREGVLSYILNRYSIEDKLLSDLDSEEARWVFVSSLEKEIRRILGVSEVFPVYCYWIEGYCFLDNISKRSYLRISDIVDNETLICSLRPQMCVKSYKSYEVDKLKEGVSWS